MDIHLTDEEYKAVQEFEWTLGGVLALTNDYFSWKEKLQSTDRVRNVVPLLMRQYFLPQEQAKLLLKGMIVEEEEKAKRLRLELESRNGMSSDLKRYIEALELYSGIVIGVRHALGITDPGGAW
jgi:Terpene synthase family 2, C-terminal metal binding